MSTNAFITSFTHSDDEQQPRRSKKTITPSPKRIGLGVKRKYLQENYIEIPNDGTKLKNGHLLYLYCFEKNRAITTIVNAISKSHNVEISYSKFRTVVKDFNKLKNPERESQMKKIEEVSH